MAKGFYAFGDMPFGDTPTGACPAWACPQRDTLKEARRICAGINKRRLL